MPEFKVTHLRYVAAGIAVIAGLFALYHSLEMAFVDEAHFPTGWGGEFRYSSQSTYVVLAVAESFVYFIVASLLWRSGKVSWLRVSFFVLAIVFFAAHFV